MERGSLIRSGGGGVGLGGSWNPNQSGNSPRRTSGVTPRRESQAQSPDFVPLTINQGQPKARQGSVHGGGGTSSNPPSIRRSVHGTRPGQSGQSSVRSPGSGKLKRGASTESYGSGGTSVSVREKDKLYLQRQAEKVAREREEKRNLLIEELRKERITMLIFSSLSLISGLLWLIALSVDHGSVLYT